MAKMGQKKREQRNRTILAALTAFIMISSVLGVLNFSSNGSSTGTSLPYGAYEFQQEQDEQMGLVWKTTINDVPFFFHFHPYQLEQFPASVSWQPLEEAQGYLLTSPSPQQYDDPSVHDAVAGAMYLFAQTVQKINKPIAFGFLNTTGYNVPTITCANATANVPVIVFAFTNETSLTQEGFCYQAHAATIQELFMLKDLFAYHILGIMQEANVSSS